MMQERRKLTRWRINHPAKIKLAGAVAFAECLVKDINFRGLSIALPLRFATDTYIRFRLQLSEEFSLDCQAWVAWHRNAEMKNIYGLLFTRITDIDKENIYKFVYKSVPGEISHHWWKDLPKEGGEKMEDRRIFQRFNIRFPVKLLNLNNGQEVIGQTYDVSAKGIGVRFRGEILQNTPLEAWLGVPDRGEPVYTRGNVAWSKVDAQGDCRLGINLERADLMGLSRILRA